jgi:TRAP-type mannitol/chloroaromatic compound transport system permease small subunit
MNAIGNAISALNQKIGDYSSLLYLVVFAVTVYDVACRYFFNSPTIWGLELVILLAGVHYMLAGAYAIKNDGHVRIDFVYRLMPRRLQMIMTIFSHLLALIFLTAIVYYGYEQAYPSVIGGETTGAGWNSHAPMYLKIAIPIGAALMVLQTIVCFVEACRELSNVR